MLRPLPTASLFATWLLLAGPGFAQAPGERERGDAEREGAAEAEEREGARHTSSASRTGMLGKTFYYEPQILAGLR